MQKDGREPFECIPIEQKIELLVFGSEELIGHGYEKFYELASLDDVYKELVEVSINNPLAAKGASQAYAILKGIKYIKYFPALLKNYHDEGNMGKALKRTTSDAMVDLAVSAVITHVVGLPVLPCYVVMIGGNFFYVAADKTLKYLENHEPRIERQLVCVRDNWDVFNTDYHVDPMNDLKVFLWGVKGVCYLPHLAHSGLSILQDKFYSGISAAPISREDNAYQGLKVSNQPLLTGFRARLNHHRNPCLLQSFGEGAIPIEKPKLESKMIAPTYSKSNLRIPLTDISSQPINPLQNLEQLEVVHRNPFSPIITGGGVSLNNNTKDGMPQWFAYLNVDPRIGIPVFVGYLLKDDIRYIVNYALADADEKPGIHLLRTVQKLSLAVKDEFHYFNLPALWCGQEAHIQKRKGRLEDAIKRMEENNKDERGAIEFLESIRYGLKTRDTSDFLDTFSRSCKGNNFSSFTEGYRDHRRRLINQFELEKNNLVRAKKLSAQLVDDFPNDPNSYVVQAIANRDDPILAKKYFEKAFQIADKEQQIKLYEASLAFYSTQYRGSKSSMRWRVELIEAAENVLSSGQCAANIRSNANEIMVNVCCDEGRFEKAIEYQTQLCKLNKTSTNFYNLACLRLSYSESQSDNTHSAVNNQSRVNCIHDLLSSLSCDPKNQASLRLIGAILYEQKNYPSAAEYYDRCTELYPNDIEAWIGSSSAHYHDKNFNRAIKNAKSALALNPQDYRGYLISALCYLEKGDVNEAKMYIGECKKISPNDKTIQALEETISEYEKQESIKRYRDVIDFTFSILRLSSTLSKSHHLSSIYNTLQNYKVCLAIPDLTQLNTMSRDTTSYLPTDHSSSSHSEIVNRAVISINTRHSFIANSGVLSAERRNVQGLGNQFQIFKF